MILYLLLKWCSIIDALGSFLILCSEYIKKEVLILVASTTIYSFLILGTCFLVLLVHFTYKGYANSFQIPSGSFHFKSLFSCPTEYVL